MATLTAAERDKLPKTAFAIPEKRAYPIHDAEHARAALSRVAANGSPDEKAKVKAAVKRRYPSMGDSEGKAETKSVKEESDFMNKKLRRAAGY